MSVVRRQRVLQCYVESSLTYGCDTWTITESILKKVEAVDVWYWSRMVKISQQKNTNRCHGGRDLSKVVGQ